LAIEALIGGCRQQSMIAGSPLQIADPIGVDDPPERL
jgi:hypothetical protein